VATQTAAARLSDKRRKRRAGCQKEKKTRIIATPRLTEFVCVWPCGSPWKAVGGIVAYVTNNTQDSSNNQKKKKNNNNNSKKG
jgi:hypothetical protein